MPEIRFFVPGFPRPGGSKKGFYIPKLRRVVITEDNKRSKDWRACVSMAASIAIQEPLQQALLVRVDFLLPRPKGHYGAVGVRPSAPKYPAVKPDATKLLRSTEDALTGIAWRDDAQIVSQIVTKRYAKNTGAWITIIPMNGAVEQALYSDAAVGQLDLLAGIRTEQ